MAQSDNAQTAKSKTPRVRSVAYPSYSIDASLSLTTKIAREFTDVVFTPREDISKNLNLSGGALLMNLSSCVQYGLLTMKSKEGYKPTDLFKKINKPLPDEDVRDFLKECFQKPPLYKKLIADLHGNELPTLSGLANILDRKFEVKGNASTLAAKIFFRNLESLGLVTNNIFSFDGNMESSDEGEAEYIEDESTVNKQGEATEQPHLLLLPSPKVKVQSEEISDYIEIPIPLKDGRKAKLLMPEGYSDEDITKVHRVVTGYLP